MRWVHRRAESSASHGELETRLQRTLSPSSVRSSVPGFPSHELQAALPNGVSSDLSTLCLDLTVVQFNWDRKSVSWWEPDITTSLASPSLMQLSSPLGFVRWMRLLYRNYSKLQEVRGSCPKVLPALLLGHAFPHPPSCSRELSRSWAASRSGSSC